MYIEKTISALIISELIYNKKEWDMLCLNIRNRTFAHFVSC